MISKFRHWWQQWRELAPWERRVLLQFSWRLPFAWVLLRVLDFKRVLRYLELHSSPFPGKPIPAKMPAAAFAHRCAHLAEIAGCHGLYRANCLHKSVVLCRFLRSAGLQVELRIGVMPRSKPMQAHAWVEFDGVHLGHQSIDGYQVFEQLTPASFSSFRPGSIR